ncbi:enamine deaminase RidA [Sphingomonadales bacterium EhC05]|nr:enamine deaminase RidA [Sphingomonadales bacterium EhC05]
MNVKMEVIAIDPDPLAPYAIAPGWRVGDVLFLSGQAAIDESGTIIGAGDIDAQISQTFVNIDKVLAAGGSSRDRIVKVTIYLTDMAHFPQIVDPRKKYFSSPYPADTIVEVSALALPELMVEIDVIAAA